MKEPGLFDLQDRLVQLEEFGRPLSRLNELADWELFRPSWQTLREKDRKSLAGRKPDDVLLIVKILIVQSSSNLSDAQIEFLIKDSLSFM